eukprot:CAMPEP_0194383934 /NCGR_PEP_ID=MMETSP0174-20130528/70786_1 /TAXON_ID=216777 /ORGANISM="Proboscia alata, Strain PI-D3" /LENGTH=365 /DNA_ID=CAMNT_0039170645 /DNA_START=17 /DNA_END=1114 /DNA_ORIENTATION=+
MALSNRWTHRDHLLVAFLILNTFLRVSSFTQTKGYSPANRKGSCTTSTYLSVSPFDTIIDYFKGATGVSDGVDANKLVSSLVVDELCYTSESGAVSFGEACADDIVYEDRYQTDPILGKSSVTQHMCSKVAARNGKGEFRLDRITDGKKACGFAWTYTCEGEEGLRGTTFVELNDAGQISYVREIPEPIYKPGDLTVQLLSAVTKDAPPNDPVDYEKKSPTVACEVAKYLFNDVQGSSIDESMRFFDEDIVYRDFNYEDVLNGKDEVRKFIEDFSFPGITFRLQRIDDGMLSTCFTWEVALYGTEDTVKGISLYELDPSTKLISYVRDVPESSIKPPPLGKVARGLRPGLGVFQGVALGSRDGGK